MCFRAVRILHLWRFKTLIIIFYNFYMKKIRRKKLIIYNNRDKVTKENDIYNKYKSIQNSIIRPKDIVKIYLDSIQ